MSLSRSTSALLAGLAVCLAAGTAAAAAAEPEVTVTLLRWPDT